MAFRLTVAEALEQVGKRLQEHYGALPIPASELRRQAAQLCGRRQSSVIPSDICYNRTNAGVSLPNRPLFVQQGHGQYRFVGRNYPYTGVMLHKPHGQAERVVGRWDNGTFTPDRGDKHGD